MIWYTHALPQYKAMWSAGVANLVIGLGNLGFGYVQYTQTPDVFPTWAVCFGSAGIIIGITNLVVVKRKTQAALWKALTK